MDYDSFSGLTTGCAALVGVLVIFFQGGTRKQIKNDLQKKGETQKGTVTRPSLALPLPLFILFSSLSMALPVHPSILRRKERRKTKKGAREKGLSSECARETWTTLNIAI
jgi:hypothetical protein